ncbi:MAG: hypothetical protein LBP72_03160, partial [Dysgonamonadaceae bacterium]|nr:hypothetical protein [Dysgonamonadaceae bacterium]
IQRPQPVQSVMYIIAFLFSLFLPNMIFNLNMGNPKEALLFKTKKGGKYFIQGQEMDNWS